jgi:porphobilinogen synthase
VLPAFVSDSARDPEPIGALPGQFRWPVDRLAEALEPAVEGKVGAVLLFGVTDRRDELGSRAAEPAGPMVRGIATVRAAYPDLVVIADICLCGATSHGHCGVVTDGRVDNDATLPLLADMAVAAAAAGADLVAPSAMMDGQVAAIRAALDRAGHHATGILSYAAKFASAWYGPFREAVGSTPAFGDRRGYQLQPANLRDALREVALDVAEGADLVMVKPAGLYLDVIRAVRQQCQVPLAAYQVSGEYAAIKAAAERGWLDERAAALESLMAIRRAGADLIVTYWAEAAIRWLGEVE